MSVALGVESPRQFVRYGPLVAVVVGEEPADAASQRAIRGAVRSGRWSPDPAHPTFSLLRGPMILHTCPGYIAISAVLLV
jgi:hypothetical protein